MKTWLIRKFELIWQCLYAACYVLFVIACAFMWSVFRHGVPPDTDMLAFIMSALALYLAVLRRR